MKKIDLEAKLYMYILRLKEEKVKMYSSVESDYNVVYVFDDYNEFNNYFIVNGYPFISDDLLKLCIMKTTKKGSIIALKGLCDHTIGRHLSNFKELREMDFDSYEEKESIKLIKKKDYD